MHAITKHVIQAFVFLTLSTCLVGCGGKGPVITSSAGVSTLTTQVTVTVSQSSIGVGGTVMFSAKLGNQSASGGYWIVQGGTTNGSITPNGAYTAPAVIPTPAAVSVCYMLNGLQYCSSVTIVGGSFAVQPTMLSGGNISLTLTGTGFSAGEVVLLNGQAMQTTVVSSTQIIATGFLTPWSTGFAVIALTVGGIPAPIASTTVPIAPTAVSYDVAARFSTQAAFGPRPDVVQEIQQLGLDPFITQQFRQPANQYLGNSDFFRQMVNGSSLLRPRVAYALETFIVGQMEDFQPSSTFLETKLENDANGNFLQLLTDITSDPNIATFLNLVNNWSSTDSLVQPNQNFARELMQLFTLGPQLLNDDGSVQTDSSGIPIPTYDQTTVVNLTRALTGWTYHPIVNEADSAWGIDFSQSLISYDPLHDQTSKQLFGTITLQAGQSALEDRDNALKAIFNHPNLPPFVSRLLIQQLVTSNPSRAYIQRVSSVFKNDGNGTRGNMDAVIRAILEDPEARAGDVAPSPNDGYLQSPIKFELFVMAALQDRGSDDQIVYPPATLGENMWQAPTVFYFFSPSYVVPGTTISSPEFMLFNNVTAIQRSQVLWGIISSQQPGFTMDYKPTSWLFSNFKTVPTMVEALNHLLYHGQMSQDEQAEIINYCAQIDVNNTALQLESAVFLAMNSDSYNISH